MDWKHLDLEKVFWAPCAYSPGKSDIENSDRVGPSDQQTFTKNNGEKIIMPKKFKHWLGTTKNGADVLSGLIHGIKISLFIGILSMLLASVIGIVLGALAGYFGNLQLKTSRAQYWLVMAAVFLAFFYAFFVRSYDLKDAFTKGSFYLLIEILKTIVIFFAIIFLSYFVGKKITYPYFLKKEINVPVDSFISRGIEILNSLPVFILILTLSAISRPSFITLILIMGLTTWAGIARLTRAEFLRISKLDYIQAGKALGLSEVRIIFRHALPNGIAPTLIQIAFGIAGAILVESSLSFLGVGVPPEMVTWGSILSEAKEDFSAWWLVIFPGTMIFITVTMYNLIGEGLRDALDPRLKK
jgi:peptide/nickel transport system permease protein